MSVPRGTTSVAGKPVTPSTQKATPASKRKDAPDTIGTVKSSPSVRAPSVATTTAVKKEASTTTESKDWVSNEKPKRVKRYDTETFFRPPPKLSVSDDFGGLEVGGGVFKDPFRQILRETPNESDCVYCPDTTCNCNEIENLLESTFDSLSLRRITSVAGKKHMCAKSIMTNFVARVARILNIQSTDIFYDLGSGNGSVLFQIAYITGADCIGIELCPHNSELSRQAWSKIKPKLDEMAAAEGKGRKVGNVTILTGDLCKYINDPDSSFKMQPNTVIWTSNLLMPKPVTAYMAEKFRYLPPGSRIACFDDLYPHSREAARRLDPEAFELFDMEDYEWPNGAVEWTYNEGPFYVHRRTKAIKKVEEDVGSSDEE